MSETKISVQKGLNDLKLLNSKITRAISNAKFVAVEQMGRIPNSNTPKDKYIQEAQGSMDKIDQLIKNRDAIKGAIIVSNAQTLVTIGGNQMSVAEAIERKDSIDFENSLLSTLKYQRQKAVSDVERINAKVDSETERNIEIQVGKDTKAEESIRFAESVRESAEARKAKVLEGVKDLDEKIEALETKIETFLSEVDFVLTESNVKTDITVDLA